MTRSTRALWARRRRMYVSIANLETTPTLALPLKGRGCCKGGGAAVGCLLPLQGEGWDGGGLLSPRSLEVMRERELVGARRVIEAASHRPRHDLVMQRNENNFTRGERAHCACRGFA